MIERISFQVPARGRAISLGLMVLGAAAAAFGLYSDPKRTWPSLLLNGFYFAALALISVFFLASQRLAGSRWSASLRRIPEALMSAMPAAAILVLVLFFGRNDLFPWADHDKVFHDAPAIAGKVQYLRCRMYSPAWRWLWCFGASLPGSSANFLGSRIRILRRIWNTTGG